MNDADYIREAVDLADGWEWNWNRPFCDAITKNNAALCLCVDNMEQWMLDALAAQLVRQVDKILDDWRCLELFPVHTAVLKFEPLSENGKDIAVCYGMDRTMNTIRAIVDSKILKTVPVKRQSELGNAVEAGIDAALEDES